jgi:MinD-like ATPase involved in chromosome partitioning or flagellar assembly
VTATSRLPVLLAAGGATWETEALRRIDAASGLVLLKRCMDIADLLAAATVGSAGAAVVSADVRGLDADVVLRLRRDGVVLVVVTRTEHDAERLARMGVVHLLAEAEVEQLPDVLLGIRPQPPVVVEPVPAEQVQGRVVAVWGPAGAPGRTTVAVGLAAELAHRGTGALLLDADPYGGAVAQHLGVLDQVSGLLAGSRLANSGQLDLQRLAGAARQVRDGLRVLTGLPRADRWVEVRPQAYDGLLTSAARLEPHVVVDTGFCLEQDADGYAAAYGGGDGPVGRNAMTLATLGRADRLVVVGSADPVGLTRLVRGLHELTDLSPDAAPLVVVNRMRTSLGWSERDIVAAVCGIRPGATVRFLPDDRAAVDRALAAGRSLVECGDSPLSRALADVADVVQPREPVRAGRRRLRR